MLDLPLSGLAHKCIPSGESGFKDFRTLVAGLELPGRGLGPLTSVLPADESNVVNV